MATMRVKPDGDVATFVIQRNDGHELSLSSCGNSLIHWHGGTVIFDYGPFYDVEGLLYIATQFIREVPS